MRDMHIPLSPPFLWYDQLNYSSPYHSQPHSHPAWQLTLSIEGVFYFEHHRKRSFIAPGEWILFSPEVTHIAGSDSENSEAIQIFFRHFPPESLPEFSRRLNFLRDFCTTGLFAAGKAQKTEKAFERLIKGETPAPYTLKKLLPLSFLVDALEETLPGLSPGKDFPSDLLPVLEYMEEHFAGEVGIGDLAAIMGLSESRFNTVFRKAVGLSPMHYFNEIRLSHAQALLLSGESVESTAGKSGFNSVSYFCRKFKKYTGRRPGEFQKEERI